MIYEAVDPNANIIFGALVDDSMNGEVAITVIATGFPLGKSEEEMHQQTIHPQHHTVADAIRGASKQKKEEEKTTLNNNNNQNQPTHRVSKSIFVLCFCLLFLMFFV